MRLLCSLWLLTVLIGCSAPPLARMHASAGCTIRVGADSNELVLLLDEAFKALPRESDGLEEEGMIWAGTVAAHKSELHLAAIHNPERSFQRELLLHAPQRLTDRHQAFDDAHYDFDDSERLLPEELDCDIELRWQIFNERAPDGVQQLRILVRSTAWFRSKDEDEEAALVHECLTAGLSTALAERARSACEAVLREWGTTFQTRRWGPGLAIEMPQP